MKIFGKLAFACAAIAIGSTIAAGRVYAGAIDVDFVTSNGRLGTTGVTYTVTSNAAEIRTLTSPPYSSDNATFTTHSDLGQFLDNYAGANMTTTITFSEAIAAKNVVALFDNIIGGGPNIGQLAQITVSGGTATTADFDVTDTGHSIFGNGTFINYNPANGHVGIGDLNGNSILIGSTSKKTLTTLTLYAQQPYTGFLEGVGVVHNATVPEPSSLALLGLGGAGIALQTIRRRRLAAK